jgi:DNA-binding NarL/FixJ family response regulator
LPLSLRTLNELIIVGHGLTIAHGAEPQSMKPAATTNAANRSTVPSSRGAHRPRVVLADDHTIVTEGLCRLLEPEYAVVATVADGEALIAAALELRPDIVIADISMPTRNGIDAIREIRRELPQVRAICLTMHMDRMYLAEAFEAGASGFAVKHAATEELRHAIRAVLGGGVYVSPLVGGRGADRGRRFGRGSGSRMPAKLTLRQRQVLQLVAEGYTVREIASMLALTPKTVEFHKYRIIETMGLESSAEMIRLAIQHGMIPG